MSSPSPRPAIIISGHLLDGRLPWPQSALPKTVNEALRAYREGRNRELEREAITALHRRPNLRAIGNIKKAKVLGLASLPRELDGICIDSARSRIWVIEAKDRTLALSPQQIRTAINEFTRERGYIAKLIANVELIQAGAGSVATALGVDEPHRSWDVIGLMVTRRIEPAAYAGEPRIIFCTVDTIGDTIDSEVVSRTPYAVATSPSQP